MFLFTFVPGLLAVLAIAYLVRERPHVPRPHMPLFGSLRALPSAFKQSLVGIGIAGIATGVVLFVVSTRKKSDTAAHASTELVVGPSWVGAQGTF